MVLILSRARCIRYFQEHVSIFRDASQRCEHNLARARARHRFFKVSIESEIDQILSGDSLIITSLQIRKSFPVVLNRRFSREMKME